MECAFGISHVAGGYYHVRGPFVAVRISKNNGSTTGMVMAKPRRQAGPKMSLVLLVPRRKNLHFLSMTSSASEHAEDPEQSDTGVSQEKKKRWPGKKSLEQFHVGQKVTGKVFRLMPYGAYVDIGADKAGLLHVRDMSTEFVDRPEDVLSNKQTVEVYIKYLDVEENKLALSLIPRTATSSQKKLADFALGEEIQGSVQRVTNYGVYLDVGANCDAFLHVSEIWGRRPRETMESMRFGESVRAWVSHIDETKGHLRVSARGSRTDKSPVEAHASAEVDMVDVFKRPSQRNQAPGAGTDFLFDEDEGSDYS